MEFFKICNQKFRNKIDLWGRADKQIDADIEALAYGLKSKTFLWSFFDQRRDNFEIVVSELFLSKIPMVIDFISFFRRRCNFSQFQMYVTGP